MSNRSHYRYPQPAQTRNHVRRCFALSIALFAGACGWVDSTGVQPGDDVVTVIALEEITPRTLDFASFADRDNTIDIRGWQLLAEGALPECSRTFDLTSSGSTLQEACSPLEQSCELLITPAIAENGEEDPQRLILLPPALSRPVGLKYQWELQDSSGLTRQVDSSLCIKAVDDAPAARGATYTVEAGSILQIADTVLDDQCQPLRGSEGLLRDSQDDHHLGAGCVSVELLELPVYAANDFTADFSAQGGFRYEPQADRDSAFDQFRYRVFDGALYSEPVEIKLVTLDTRTLPQLQEDLYNIGRNSRNNRLTPLSNDVDPLGGALELVLITTPPNRGGSVSIQDDGSLLYTPRFNFRGNESFGYSVTNTYGQLASSTIVTRVR